MTTRSQMQVIQRTSTPKVDDYSLFIFQLLVLNAHYSMFIAHCSNEPEAPYTTVLHGGAKANESHLRYFCVFQRKHLKNRTK